MHGIERLAPPLQSATDEAVPGLVALTAMVRSGLLGPTTQSLVDAASGRHIPVERLDDHSLIRLGWGSRQRMLRASVASTTPHLAVTIAGDKRATKALLAAAGVPVPRGVVTSDRQEAIAFAERSAEPVVTKPLRGNHGRGVSTGLVGEPAVTAGFDLARTIGRDVIVEHHVLGRDFRLLVVDGRLVAAAERVPPTVTGDGSSSIAELIAALNLDPRRGDGHENVMTRVHIDDALRAVLATQGLDTQTVLPPGRVAVLRHTANLSTGASAIDCTDDVHPDVRCVAERAARVVGLDIAGIDLVTTDIREPLSVTGGAVVEVNAAPGFRMHLKPSEGAERDVAGAVVDMLYPPGTGSRIPVISVTGTNGKSTTVQMVAHILAESPDRPRVGVTSTSGVYVGGHRVMPGDSSGPRSARLVLADPSVDIAVLETARGGLLREGLAYDRANIGIVLNVSEDHLGLKGIDTLKDLARLKSVVARRVRRSGVSVLNLDDRWTRRMASVAGGHVAFFTLLSREQALARYPGLWDDCELLATLEQTARGGVLTVHTVHGSIPIIAVGDIPATHSGAATFNTANALAAALACHALRVPTNTIARALAEFDSTFDQNPGRLNITTAPGFTTIVDYAHNPAALRALGDLVATMRHDHDRVIGVVSTPGDRRDADIRALGGLSAQIFDEVIFRELPDGRGRAVGGVVGLLSDAALDAGLPAESIHRVMDESQAMDAAMRMAGPRDLVVLTVSSVTSVWDQVNAFVPEWSRVDA